MLKQYTLCLLTCLMASLATAQLNLGLQLNFQPDPDPRRWADQDGLLIVTAVNPTGQSYDFRYRGKMLLDGKVVMDNSLNKMPVENIGAFETTISEVQDVLPPVALNLYSDIENTYLRTNQIPAGVYLVCAQIVTPDGSQALSAEACVPLVITSYQQPSLVFPAADMPMPMNSLPTFAWTPVTPPPPFPVNYRLQAVEVSDVFTPDEEDSSTKYQPANALVWSAAGEIGGVWGIGNEDGEPLPIHHAQATGSATNPTANRAQATGSATNPTANRAQATGSATNPTANRSASSTNLMQAFQYGFPLLDLELPGQTQAIWPPDVQEPQPGRQYVWSVQAIRADDGSPVGANNGTAEPRAFTIASPPEEEEADFPIPLAIVQLGGCYLNVYDDGTWRPADCPTAPITGNGQLEISNDRGVYATGSQQPLFRTPVDLEQEWAMEAESPPTTQRMTDGSIEVLPGSKFTIANKVSGQTTLRTGGGSNGDKLPGSKFTLANKSGGSNSLLTGNGEKEAKPGSRFTLANKSGGSNSLLTGNGEKEAKPGSRFTLANKSGGANSLLTGNGPQGDNTPGMDGDPIPGIDVALEQIPGGFAPPSPGTENLVAVVQYGGQTFALLNDGTWDNLLPAPDNPMLPHWEEEVTNTRIYLCIKDGKADPVTNCKNCKGDCIGHKRIAYHAPGGNTNRAASRPQPDPNKMAIVNFLPTDVEHVLLCQNPVTGDITKINAPDECPVGSYLLEFEQDGRGTRSPGEPIAGRDVKVGKSGGGGKEQSIETAGQHGHTGMYDAACPQCQKLGVGQAPTTDKGIKAPSANEPPPPAAYSNQNKNSGRNNTSGCCANYVVIAAPKSPTDPLARKAPLTVEKPFGETPDAETMDIMVFDANRQEVSGWTMQSFPQDKELSIDLSKLPAGEYTVRMIAGVKVKEVKVGEAPALPPANDPATNKQLEAGLKQGVIELNKKRAAEIGFSISTKWTLAQPGSKGNKYASVSGKVTMKDPDFGPGSHIFIAAKGVVLTSAPLSPDGSFNLLLKDVGNGDESKPVYVRSASGKVFCYEELPPAN